MRLVFLLKEGKLESATELASSTIVFFMLALTSRMLLLCFLAIKFRRITLCRRRSSVSSSLSVKVES